MSAPAPRILRVRALAKINLTLRVLGRRADGYHELRSTFQSIAMHDRLTLTASRGPFALECDEAACPADQANLVSQAADRLWRAAGRRGSARGIRVRLEKRIPLQAGLGGGSSDAAAALRAVAALWRVKLGPEDLGRIAADLGADVPFFLQGGTALGVERGDVLFPLRDWPPSWVVLLLPDFGVSTREAYGWWDRARGHARTRERQGRAAGSRTARSPSSDAAASWGVPASELRNDLQAPVARKHPDIGRLVRRLESLGAAHAAMSGSGSAIFGLFDSARDAEAAAGDVKRNGVRAIVTRTVTRAEFAVLSRLQRLAAG
jgi:4-diphosphocytidyl-2-C-methyl-D-erythritol kinase